MNRLVSNIWIVLLISHGSWVWAQDAKVEFFERKVRPILAEHCYACHSGGSDKLQAELRVDHGSLLLSGGESGPAIVPGNADESLLIQAVRYDGYEMPPTNPLSGDEVQVLVDWVNMGAPWPDEPVPDANASHAAFDIHARMQGHWAWQPKQTIKVPKMTVAGWSDHPIDAFIADRLTQNGLEPAERADKRVLIRRVYLDLLGIPPTASALDFHLNNASVEWFSELIDSLLADPQFGVRFARHWLDLVRYAQSRGHEFDEDIIGAEHYRDYVVRAINSDLPYDQFIREQLAGDLIEPPRRHPTLGWNESILGTGFWHLGEWVHSPVDVRKDETDRFDNMVDVASKSFMALTVSCARCHDHKFDAISAEDYYALFGFLRSSHYRLVRFETDCDERQATDRLAKVRDRYQTQLKSQIIPWLGCLENSEGDRLKANAILKECDRKAASLQPLDAKDASVRFDARSVSDQNWFANGPAFGSKPIEPGTFRLSGTGPDAELVVQGRTEILRDPFWNKLRSIVPGFTNQQSRYAQWQDAGQTYISPSFVLNSNKLSFLVRGDARIFVAVDSYRLIAGPLHGEMLSEHRGDESQWRWVESPSLERYRSKIVHIEFMPMGPQETALVQVVDGPVPAIKKPHSDLEPLTIASLIHWLELTEPIDSPQYAFALRRLVRELPNFEIEQTLRDWVRDEQEIAKGTRWESHIAMAMIDGTGQNDRLLIRGNSDRPGHEVARRNLEALGGKNAVPPSIGSGRLEWAKQIVAPESPLASRVAANRVWHHLFGRGIVATTDDFGVQGQLPTHPELLDYLSEYLVEQGWSMKALVRHVCLSETYQMDSTSSELAHQIDPTNALCSHRRVRRLEAEALRDTLMWVADDLDLRLEGETPPVHLTDFLQGRGRPGKSGPANGQGRRSIYLEVRRNFLNPMMTTFDMPTPFSAMGRRNVSNIPAQSLVLLNDPWVHELAKHWADRVCEQNDSRGSRLQAMYQVALGREPTAQEMKLAEEFLEAESSDQAWQALAHVLMNSKELLFRY